MRFKDRREAGRVLATKLTHYAGMPNVLVLALPRGGVPVAFEVAAALRAPLDVFIVRKLGSPGHEEYAMGAIASGGVRVMNSEVARMGISKSVIQSAVAREQAELERREKLYRGDRATHAIAQRIVILVDDGLATGSTMRAAAIAVKNQAPLRVVVAVPIAALDTCEDLRTEVDEAVCVATPEPFHAVGLWYDDFSPTTDEEVRTLLDATNATAPLLRASVGTTPGRDAAPSSMSVHWITSRTPGGSTSGRAITNDVMHSTTVPGAVIAHASRIAAHCRSVRRTAGAPGLQRR